MCKRDGLACMRGLLAICLTDLSHNITNMFVDILDSLRWAVQASRRLAQRSADAWGSISRVGRPNATASVLSEKFLLLTLIDGSLSSFDLV